MAVHSIRVHGRAVDLYVPPGYDGSRRHELLVLHDGQNLFDPASSHAGQTWEVAETLDRLIATGETPPLVVAGVAHAGDDRITEFTPTPSGGRGGHAAEYADFVIYDLIPSVARELAVRTDFDGLAIGGSSLGGLVSLFIASAFPGRFGRLVVMSPSVWWDNRAILRLLRQRPLKPPPRVWLDAGIREGRSVLFDARALHRLLAEQGVTVQYLEDLDGDHSERAWATRFPHAMRWLWSDAPAGGSQTVSRSATTLR
jgi:enterochelin esterase-like enzyme